MKPPLKVRPLTDAEGARLEAGLHSSESFILRRCQILLASARGEWPSHIATEVGCSDQTVRNVLKRFEQEGVEACLMRRSNRPLRPKTKIDEAALERLREMLHQSPRQFGKASSIWTLGLAAEVSFAEGITKDLVSDEAIRLAMRRLGMGWKRAKQWITSPDPEYARKKDDAAG
jgi:transposase